MTPDERRRAVQRLREQFGVSERRACGLVGIGRSSCRYTARPRADDQALRERLCALATGHLRFGYRQLGELLRREGVAFNHQRVERLYRVAGLPVRRRGRKRLAGLGRGAQPQPTRVNEQWGLDFVSEATAPGQRVRLLTVVDTFSREALAIAVDTSLPGERVVRVLTGLVAERGAPARIVLDNGPELTSRALDQWADQQGGQLRFSQPGKPVQHAFVESVGGRLRDECRNQHWFTSLAVARTIVEAWRTDSNERRPHRALGDQTPAEFCQADRLARQAIVAAGR